MTILLTACVGMHYQETEYVINGYQVYLYDHRTSEVSCDRISPFGLFVREEENDYVTDKDFGECKNTLYVKKNGTFYNLSEAIELDFFTIEEVLSIDWKFAIYETHSLLYYTDVESFIFSNDSESITYTDVENIERVLGISESIYQKFIIDYLPANLTQIGEISVLNGEGTFVVLEVYEEGIYDPFTNAFQERYTSEIFGLYSSIIN